MSLMRKRDVCKILFENSKMFPTNCSINVQHIISQFWKWNFYVVFVIVEANFCQEIGKSKLRYFNWFLKSALIIVPCAITRFKSYLKVERFRLKVKEFLENWFKSIKCEVNLKIWHLKAEVLLSFFGKSRNFFV